MCSASRPTPWIMAEDDFRYTLTFGPEVFGVLLQYPATDGAVTDYHAFCERAHAAGALVTAATDLLALTLLTPPGDADAVRAAIERLLDPASRSPDRSVLEDVEGVFADPAHGGNRDLQGWRFLGHPGVWLEHTAEENLATKPVTKGGEVRDLAAAGMTMIVISHEMGFARSAANRVVFMDGGRILEAAPPEEFFASPRTERAKDFLSKIISH